MRHGYLSSKRITKKSVSKTTLTDTETFGSGGISDTSKYEQTDKFWKTP